jgi:hypothetical protein
VLVIGALVRIETYLDNPSMWLDEVGLAQSFLVIEFSDLLAPLPTAEQQAPPLFSLLSLVSVRLLGTSEFAFRIVPLLGSLAALGLFAALAPRLLSVRGTLVAVTAFAGAPMALRYAGEFKPYATDLLVSLVVVALAIWLRRSGVRRAPWLVAGVVGALLAWASYTAIFVLAGAGFALLHDALTASPPERDQRMSRTIALGAVWFLGFLGFWALVGRWSADDLFYQYWQDSFAPLPFSPSGLAWYADAATDVMRTPMEWGWGKKPGALLMALGGLLLLRRERTLGVLVVMPGLLVLVASGLGQYPFSGRLIFFCLPFMLLALAEGTDHLAGLLARVHPMLAAVVVAAVLAQPAAAVVGEFATRVEREESRELIAYLLANRQPADQVYCYHHAEKAFRFYAAGRAECVSGVRARPRVEGYAEDLAQFAGTGRVWLFFTHVTQDEERRWFLPYLDEHGRLLEAHHAFEASLYLYDM